MYFRAILALSHNERLGRSVIMDDLVARRFGPVAAVDRARHKSDRTPFLPLQAFPIGQLLSSHALNEHLATVQQAQAIFCIAGDLNRARESFEFKQVESERVSCGSLRHMLNSHEINKSHRPSSSILLSSCIYFDQILPICCNGAWAALVNVSIPWPQWLYSSSVRQCSPRVQRLF